MTWVALCAAPVLFGFADFFGGVLSRRVSPWAVVGVTSAVSAVFALVWAVFTGSLAWEGDVVVRGVLAGVLYVVGYALFFRALSIGKAGVVGAIVSLSLLPPVLADVIRGQLPSAPQLLGIVAIGVGVVVISQPRSIRRGSGTYIIIAVAAALLLGTQYVLLGRASQANPDLGVICQFAAAALVVLVIGLVKRTMGGVDRAVAPRLLGLGALFGIAGLCFSAAMSGINVAVVSAVVLTEPAVLAILGLVFKDERLTPTQWGALVVVIAGAVLTSAG